MEKIWKVARQRKVYGPYSEPEMMQFALEGRLSANELVQKTGTSEWKLAHDVFDWMLPPDDVPLAEFVPEVKKVRITCFGCYSETTVTPAPESFKVACRSCGSELVVEPMPADQARHHREFAGLGGGLTERIQQKMRDAYAADADSQAILSVIAAIVKAGA
jgi:hypothetical protein